MHNIIQDMYICMCLAICLLVQSSDGAVQSADYAMICKLEAILSLFTDCAALMQILKVGSLATWLTLS